MSGYYPEGVTGREFAINGWDVERPDNSRECPVCYNNEGTLYIYNRDAEWWCHECDAVRLEWDAQQEYEDNKADDAYDDWRDRRDERDERDEWT